MTDLERQLIDAARALLGIIDASPCDGTTTRLSMRDAAPAVEALRRLLAAT